MRSSQAEAGSLLAIDVGSVNTRAWLFEVVDGRYRFVASGQAPTTADAPYNNVGEGVRIALDRLQTATGHLLMDANDRLIVPSRPDGAGVDAAVATLSAGAPLNVAVIGLLDDVSLASIQRLASGTYAQVVERISLSDRRKPEARLDALLRLRPNVVLVAGGTDGGATQSVHKLLEVVGLLLMLLPEGDRPEILYVGNQALQGGLKDALGRYGHLHFAPNVRPQLDVEQLEPAQMALAHIFRQIRLRRLPGLLDLDSWSGGGLKPSALAYGRVIRFLSTMYDSAKGVLGVDIGASSTVMAAAFSGELLLGVYPEYGLGPSLVTLLERCQVKDLQRWLTIELSEDDLRNYLANKSLYPGTIPVSMEELAIEGALARQLMQLALRKLATDYYPRLTHKGTGLLPGFEPIVASGSVLSQAPSLAGCLLMLLDGLQPTGVTTLVLDTHQITPALGAAAQTNPVLSIQVLESNAFTNLGTVISPVGEARPGTPILRVRMTQEGGQEIRLDVKQGTIEVLPLPVGQPGRLQLRPLHRYDVGLGGAGRGGSLRVVGGALGVIIDARGRPLRLPVEIARRRELYKRWMRVLSG